MAYAPKLVFVLQLMEESVSFGRRWPSVSCWQPTCRPSACSTGPAAREALFHITDSPLNLPFPPSVPLRRVSVCHHITLLLYYIEIVIVFKLRLFIPWTSERDSDCNVSDFCSGANHFESRLITAVRDIFCFLSLTTRGKWGVVLLSWRWPLPSYSS